MWGNFRARISRGWEAIKSGQRKWMWIAGKKIISKNEREGNQMKSRRESIWISEIIIGLWNVMHEIVFNVFHIVTQMFSCDNWIILISKYFNIVFVKQSSWRTILKFDDVNNNVIIIIPFYNFYFIEIRSEKLWIIS